MAKPIITRNPTCTITFGSTVVDIGEHVRTVTPADDVNIVENRTFARPDGRDFGNHTKGITLGLGWSSELYDALSPYVDVPGTLRLKPRSTDTRVITATVRYGTLPWGDFTDGEAADGEVELIADSDITLV